MRYSHYCKTEKCCSIKKTIWISTILIILILGIGLYRDLGSIMLYSFGSKIEGHILDYEIRELDSGLKNAYVIYQYHFRGKEQTGESLLRPVSEEGRMRGSQKDVWSRLESYKQQFPPGSSINVYVDSRGTTEPAFPFFKRFSEFTVFLAGAIIIACFAYFTVRRKRKLKRKWGSKKPKEWRLKW